MIGGIGNVNGSMDSENCLKCLYKNRETDDDCLDDDMAHDFAKIAIKE